VGPFVMHALTSLAVVAADALCGVPSQAAGRHDAAGQVWEYKMRAGDEGSLLKIRQIEADPASATRGPIYRISMIGFHLSNPQVQPILPRRARVSADAGRKRGAPLDQHRSLPGRRAWNRGVAAGEGRHLCDIGVPDHRCSRPDHPQRRSLTRQEISRSRNPRSRPGACGARPGRPARRRAPRRRAPSGRSRRSCRRGS
jgi:hypothetical protein